MKDRVNVLGTEYRIEFRNYKDDPKLEKLDGYADFSEKLIVCEQMKERNITSIANIKIYQNKVLRHEIIHAFIYESGLDCNSYEPDNWAENEEMIDWFAIQSPKIYKIFKELNILNN